MSVQGVKAVLKMDATLSTAQRFVLVSLAEHASGKPLRAWPSAALIAAETAQTREHVTRCLKALREAGFIAPVGKRGGGVIVYVLNMPLIEAHARPDECEQGSQGGDSGSQGSEQGSHAPVIVDHTEPPTRTTQEPKDIQRAAAASSPDEFDAWWSAYPRKIGKAAARKAYTKAVKATTPERLLESVKAYPWPQEVRFIPHPTTWLNQERWEDDLAAAKAGAAAPTAGGWTPVAQRDRTAYADHWADPNAQW